MEEYNVTLTHEQVELICYALRGYQGEVLKSYAYGIINIEKFREIESLINKTKLLIGRYKHE